MTSAAVLVLAALCVFCYSIQGYSQDGEKPAGDDFDEKMKNMAEELVKIRTEVDRLSSELNLKKTEMKNDLCSLAEQKIGLERQIKSEELKVADLDKKIEKQKKEIERKESAGKRLKSNVLKQIEKVRAHVKETLPFKREERLYELEKMQKDVEDEKVEADRVLARLWSMCEDEIRLTRESGLYDQSVTINGKEYKADVVRLGMILLYFRTIDETDFGYAVKDDQGWTYRVFPEDDKENIERVRYIFDCFKKHIQDGFYELPNPYAVKGGK